MKSTVMRWGRVFCVSGILLLALIGRAAGAPDEPRLFGSAEEARQALVQAVAAKDRQALSAIFGAEARELESSDPVERNAELEEFSRHLLEANELVYEGEERAILRIGNRRWPFPVPLVRGKEGWRFDTRAGREEVLNRRIGRDELLAINACRAYVEAQREYYNMPVPDGEQIPKYAQHFISRPGRHDGLYWPTVKGERESPLGPLVAKAKEEGYFGPQKGEPGRRPFHGYYFRILKRQGKNAAGGSYSYLINGNMVAGHALVAYPARWGKTGVMTFIVNQRGRVYQKNLGPHTAELARQMREYDPDLSWKVVQ